MGSLIVNAFLKYIQTHPDVLERIVEALVDAIVAHLKGSTPAA